MHRGGLGDHVYDQRFAAKVRELAAGDGGQSDFYFKPSELVQFILKRKPLSPAGQKYAYTDTGYILLGMIIERAGGASYYEQLHRRFLEPLKLELTTPADKRDIPGVAAGYLAANNPFGLPAKTTADDGKLRFHPANEWTGGGLVSNPADLVRWAKKLFEGEALEKPYVEQLVAADPADKDKPRRYGLGVFVAEGELGKSYGHGGWYPGYLTQVEYYPAERVAVAFQINTDARRDVARDVLALVRDVLQTVGKAP
jgi:D-alanyl-D-alanine carboxypeptidase